MIKIKKDKTYFSKYFLKDLKKLELTEQSFIKDKIKKIFLGEININIKKLRNYPLGNYRIRFGKFRLILEYHTEKQIVVFSACRKRKDLY